MCSRAETLSFILFYILKIPFLLYGRLDIINYFNKSKNLLKLSFIFSNNNISKRFSVKKGHAPKISFDVK